MFLKISLLLLLASLSQQGIYQKYYDEGYRIAVAMSLDQKIGQCLQVDFNAFNDKKGTDETLAAKLHLGSLLVGGDGMPDDQGNMVIIPEKEDQDRDVYSKSTLNKWQKLSAKFNYSIAITTSDGKSYDIRPLLGTDAVHGNQHVSGTILFPHNVGLACTHNPDNFYNAGYWTALGVKKTGFNYAFSPTVAVSHNPQWGRFYETVGQEEDYIYNFAKSYTQGLQGQGILGSVKHFYADGATLYGADEGNAIVGSFRSFIRHNTQGYNGSIAANIGSVMVSYSAINWLPNAIGPAISSILRRKLKFDGFVISDYDEMERIISQGLPTNFNIMNGSWDSVSQMVNSGIDMLMIPGWRGIKAAYDAVTGFKEALKNGTLSQERLNDAVARILSVKLALGVATQVKTSALQQENIVSESTGPAEPKLTTEYQDSLTAVHESLVLLKNSAVIPVKPAELEYVVLVGERVININGLARNELFRNFDDIGMQNGGWTLRWQGFEGNSQWMGDNKVSSNASSILDGLKNLNQKFEILYPNYTTFTEQIKVNEERNQYLTKLRAIRKNMTAKNTLVLAVVGETTYAEFKGDVGVPYCINQTILGGVGCLYDNIGHPYLPPKERESLTLDFEKFDKEVIAEVRGEDKTIPVLTVLLAGRPMIIENLLTESSAVLAAWLPGTSGGDGIINAITGKYVIRPNGSKDRRNTLAFDWPKTQVDHCLFRPP